MKMAWIEIKEGCEMPKKRGDLQLVICGEVASGYYVPPIPRASGGMTQGGWMEYTLKGSEDCKPSHWQPMAKFNALLPGSVMPFENECPNCRRYKTEKVKLCTCDDHDR